jgi:murein DD-endopeptidase MepM/ murein hydrolase activator NlpD
MGRSRALVLTAAVSVTALLGTGALATASPAGAQDSTGTTDTTVTTPDTTDTTVPETTVPPDTTDTTVPDTTVPDTTVPPDTTPTTIDPGTNGDAPPESVPQTDAIVPPATVVPGLTSAQVPPPARVVQVDALTAQADALIRMAAYQGAVARRQELEAAVAQLQGKLNGLESNDQQAVRNMTDAHDALVTRAVYAYVRGGDEPDLWIGSDGDTDQRTVLLSAVADRDKAAIDRYKSAAAQVTADEAKTAEDLVNTQADLDLARVQEAQAQLDLNSAQLELAVTSAGGSTVIHGFVFPVASPHSMSPDFGAPRFPGTPQAHVHQGQDIVAAEGTELFAAERGIITQISSDGLGGNGLWIKGESGTYYYYAHLSAYVLGLAQGQVVEAAQLVGYVGHTGDAYGPHLHFEVHPNGGPAIDPYPILVASDPQQVASARP